ncbi:MAG: endonuclease/exonuclease/phosphatase family protein [Myxococcota bacterium]
MSTTPGPMRLGSWNCYNFYDDVPGNCGGFCKFEEVLSTTEFRNKTAGIARGLEQLDADLVVLQEVENKNVLDALAAHPDLIDKGYHTRQLVFGNDPRGINVGLLSRVPVEQYISHKDDKFTRVDDPAEVYQFARDAVEIHLTYRGHKVGIVGVHFKARINDDDPNRRVAEAQRARGIADNMLANDPDMYVFVVGDFNDTPGTDTYLAVRDGTSDGALEFEHALLSIPTSDRYTYQYGANNQLLDHLLATPNAGARLDPDSATIIHDDALPSDHAPLAATYTVP